MRSVVVVLPASMWAMMPMFRMRLTSSSADSGAAAAADDEQRHPIPCLDPAPPPPLAAEQPPRASAALAALAALMAVARGASNSGPARRRSIPLRPRLSSSDMAYLLPQDSSTARAQTAAHSTQPKPKTQHRGLHAAGSQADEREAGLFVGSAGVPRASSGTARFLLRREPPPLRPLCSYRALCRDLFSFVGSTRAA